MLIEAHSTGSTVEVVKALHRFADNIKNTLDIVMITNYKERLKFYLKDSLAKSDNLYFDIAMSIDLFDHIEDYYCFLRKFIKIAKFKIFYIPLVLSVQTVFRDYSLICSKKVGHLHYFAEKTALIALEYTVYKIIDHFITAKSI